MPVIRWILPTAAAAAACAVNIGIYTAVSSAGAPTPPPAGNATNTGTPPPAPTVVPTGADTAIASVAIEAAKTYTDTASSANPADTWPGVCASPDPGAFAINAASASGDGTSATVTVAAYTAGKASAKMNQLRKAANKCADVTTKPGQDIFTAVTSTHPATRAATFTRVGDVIVAVTIASFDGDAVTTAEGIKARAVALVTKRLAGVCADPGSATVDDTGRDPYAGAYRGHTTAATVTLDTTAQPLPPTVVAALNALPSAPTWKPPSPVAHPDLATYNTPGADATLETAGRGKPPVFIDPDTIKAPDGSAVKTKPKPPPAPTLTTEKTTVALPVADTTGPGCGWAFTSRQAPVVDAATIGKDADRATLNAVAALNRSAAVNLSQVMAWPAAQRRWAQETTVWNNWNAYYEAVKDAQAARDDAQAMYDSSLDRWTSPTPTPTPSPSRRPARPTPTPSAADPSPTTDTPTEAPAQVSP